LSDGIDISVAGLPAVEQCLLRWANPPVQQLLADMGATVEKETAHRIDSEKRSPEGEQWAPWARPKGHSSAGAESVGWALSGHSLLERTKRLLRSLQDDVGKIPVETDAVDVGTAVPYAPWLQAGVPGRMPARPFLGISDGNATELERIVDRFFGALA
jgi:phage gpG-like protein